MRILVIAGSCLKVNSSANLCHISYIKGLVELGHDVDIISMSDRGLNVDNSIILPNVRSNYTYDSSLYDRAGAKLNSNKSNKSNTNNAKKLKTKFNVISYTEKILKSLLKKMYGVYKTDSVWIKKAIKFRSNEKYDVVLSLSYPPASHRLAELLLKKKHITTERWIQIWEDPWYNDIFGYNHTKSVLKEEHRLLKNAQKVMYVSPLTLMYQQRTFADCKEKMYWKPLPSYYQSELMDVDFTELTFGYFGDYTSHIRNLLPFYNVAVKSNLNVNICGNSDLDLIIEKNIHIHPRMSLCQLQKYENQTNVLVFLCNLRGGQIPGKIYQYAATNKMILFILDGTNEEKKTIKEYFAPFNRFIFCDNNEADIICTIAEIDKYAAIPSYYTPLDCFSAEKVISEILLVD